MVSANKIHIPEHTETVKAQDFVMYGSSRLGIKKADVATQYALNTKQYELSNHLGNVLTTVSDVLIPTYDGTTLESIDALVRTQQDYYPFGMLMPERQYEFEPPCEPVTELVAVTDYVIYANDYDGNEVNFDYLLSPGPVTYANTTASVDNGKMKLAAQATTGGYGWGFSTPLEQGTYTIKFNIQATGTANRAFFIGLFDYDANGNMINITYPIFAQNMANGNRTYTFTNTGTKTHMTYGFYLYTHTPSPNNLANRFFTLDNIEVTFTGNIHLTECLPVGTDLAEYRYGFNGKENDNEVNGRGNFQDYGMRMYDTRLGRFFSEDPIGKRFPYFTPYQFAANTPIVAIDLDGLEDEWIHMIMFDDGTIVGFQVTKSSELYESQRQSLANGLGIDVSMLPSDGRLLTVTDENGVLIRFEYSDTPEISAFREPAFFRMLNYVFESKHMGNEDGGFASSGHHDGAMSGTMTHDGKTAVADGLGYAGLGFKIIGTAMVLGGVTSPLGGAMILVGEGMDLIGAGMSIENDLREGNRIGAANTFLWTSIGLGGGSGVKRINNIDKETEIVMQRVLDLGTFAGEEDSKNRIENLNPQE